MAVINQPNTQIKLTNVSIVKLKVTPVKGKKQQFEIACYKNKIQDYKNGIENDLDEILQINEIFNNVNKGIAASNTALKECFPQYTQGNNNSVNKEKIIREILNKGEINLTNLEREHKLKNINNEILTNSLTLLNFKVNLSQSAKIQSLNAIKLLIEKQIIPIKRCKMLIKTIISNKDIVDLDRLSLLYINKKVEQNENGQIEVTGLIDPTAYREILKLVSNEEEQNMVQVLDMSVIEA
ncbi:hypothetical protein ACO0OL_000817 [Hanseniaspora opuntiae]